MSGEEREQKAMKSVVSNGTILFMIHRGGLCCQDDEQSASQTPGRKKLNSLPCPSSDSTWIHPPTAVDDAPSNGQAQSRPLVIHGLGILSAVELVENVG